MADTKFTSQTIEQINIYRNCDNESRTDNLNFKLTASQKIAIKKICNEHNISVSTFIYDAVESYVELFPFKDKLGRHRRLLRDLVEKLV